MKHYLVSCKNKPRGLNASGGEQVSATPSDSSKSSGIANDSSNFVLEKVLFTKV